jgi:hypothetical protein
MLDITTELKDLRLHGMANAWTDGFTKKSSWFENRSGAQSPGYISLGGVR